MTGSRSGPVCREAVLIPRPAASAAVARLISSLAAGQGGLLAVTGPPGSGRTTLAEEAVTLAARHGFPVRREPAPSDGTATLVVLDGPAVPDRALVERLVSDRTAVLVTADRSLGLDPEVRLGGFPEPALAGLLDLPPDAVHAVWLASGGLPGPALALAGGLPPGATAADVVGRALDRPSRTDFLTPDTGLIRLLEETAAAFSDDGSPPAAFRSRVLSRLARELLADPTAAARRRVLVGQAVSLARAGGDPGVLARALDDGLHALWDPAAAPERLTTSAEIVELARRAGDAETELRGLMWRFTAQAELADLDAAEATLNAYRHAAELAGDAAAAVVVLARQAMLATVRGRLDVAASLTEQVRAGGHRIGLADTDRLVASLAGRLTLLRGEVTDEPERLYELARRLPGHFYEATAALALVVAGRREEAALELLRVLPAVLAGGGPRWLGAVADLALVAAEVGDRAAAAALYEALLPYRGRLVVWAGGNTVTGPVDDALGRLAGALGRPGSYFDSAIALERRLGALPWLVGTLRARAAPGDREEADEVARRLGLPTGPGDEWQLVRDGDRWRLDAGGEVAWLPDRRGVHYLRALLAAPGQDIAALDLVAGGPGLRPSDGGPVLDEVAVDAYRKRLADLEAETAAADRAGDADRSSAAQAERAALLAELRRATGLGGRPRRMGREAERARVNATKAIRGTVDRIAATAPLAAAHLSASLHTGYHLRYQPAAGGSPRWRRTAGPA